MTELCVSKKVDTENCIQLKNLKPGIYIGNLNDSRQDCPQHIVFVRRGAVPFYIAYSLLEDNMPMIGDWDKLYNHRPVKITQIKVQEI